MISRRWRRCAAWTASLLITAFVFMSWWAGSELAVPGRRPLQDYHHEFLASPAAHGVTLKSFTAREGTPCIVCEPLPGDNLGQRGLRIREQLRTKNLPLVFNGGIVGNLVLVHGRKGRKEDYLLIAERFCAVGFRCVIPDMPAHGDHPQTIAGYGMLEAELPERMLAEAAQRFGFDPGNAGLMGLSMGGSVAVHAAALKTAPWKALVIISSFDALEPVAQFQASRLVGAWLSAPLAMGAGSVYRMKTGLRLEQILPSAQAARLRIPTLIAHGTKDHVVPVESGRRLFAALPESVEKRWVEIPGADHDNVLITDFPIYATVAEWFLRYVPPIITPRSGTTGSASQGQPPER